MKISDYFLTCILCIVLSACGEKKNENSTSVTMKPQTTNVSGGLGDCFKVVNRDYKVIDNAGWSKLLTVEMERTEASLPFEIIPDTEIYSYSHSMSTPFTQVGFGIEFLDEDGNVLDKVSASSSGLSASYDPDEAVDLVKLKSGERGSIRFEVNSTSENATQFRISSSYTENIGSKSSSYHSTNSNNYEVEEIKVLDIEDNDESDDNDEEVISTSKVSSSKNWNAILDSYEKYVDKYISLMKKAAKGDMSALSEYPSLLQKAQEFGEQMENAQGDMTPAQWSRYMKISQKMLNAAQNM